MSNLPVPIPTSSSHPSWCDPRCCDTVAGDTVHLSTPDRWATADAEFELRIRRTVEHAFPGERPATYLTVQMDWPTEEPSEHPAELWMTPAEARDVGCWLIAAAVRAEGRWTS